MTERKKNRHFYLLFILAGLLAGLILVLPQFPQSDLKELLSAEITDILRQPCRIQNVNLQIVPRPAVVVHGLTAECPDCSVNVETAFLDISPLSLLSASPAVAGLRLQGASLKIPYSRIKDPVAETVGSDHEPGSMPISLHSLAALVRARKLPLAYIYFNNTVCTMTGINGYKGPLIFTDVAGSWNFSKRNLSEKFDLSGACGRGRGHLKMTWYQVDAAAAGDDSRAGDRLEVSCVLHGISVPGYEISPLTGSKHKIRTALKQADLKLDINGDPQSGLRFTGQLIADDHTVSVYDAVSESEELYSQGAVKASLAGFYQPRDGYVNLKSASLEYPGAAILFYRGLVRFKQSLFVDLVSELKVDDLSLLENSIPLLVWPGYRAAGRLSGQLKLIGNPQSAPVLQVNLESAKIVLHETETEVISPSVANRSAAAEGDNPVTFSGLEWACLNRVRGLADWEWQVKSECRIERLELPGLTVSDISLLAEKSTTQLELERLTAHFGKSGRVRLSMVLEDLFQEPHWQASLIVEKFNLKPFRETALLDGVLDASLVGGGLLGRDSEPLQGLDLHGKWSLRQGAFVDYPLFDSFNDYLQDNGRARLGARFSTLSGNFILRDRVLHLKQMKLVSGENQVAAGGRFTVSDESLDFSLRFIPKGSSPWSFRIVGNRENPVFKTSAR